MQADTGSTWHYELLAWYEVNKKRVMAGAIALLALILLGYVYVWNRGRAEMAADKTLLALRVLPGGGGQQPQSTAAEFLKVARDHSSTRAGERALLLAASAYFADGQYSEAQSHFEKFLSQYDDSLLASIAALGVASSLDAQEKADQALAAYQSVVTRYPNEAAAGRAKLALASLHESRNQPEQALRLYDEMVKPASMSGLTGEAVQRRSRLLRKHPNLAPTNTVALSASQPLKAASTNASAGATNVAPVKN